MTNKEKDARIVIVDRSEALITPDHPQADLFAKIIAAGWTEGAPENEVMDPN